jgi:glucose-6-phosphate 1-dehydrogenase
MSILSVPVDPFDLVILGGTGDLARRKLLPALFQRYLDGHITDSSRVIGAGRDDIGDDAYRAMVAEAMRSSGAAAADPATGSGIDEFLKLVQYARIDIEQGVGFAELAARLAQKPDNVRVFYLAVAPGLFSKACERLQSHVAIDARCRVVVEKPLGHDLPSARRINETLAATFAEPQTFRIDHYLGKETVQNLTALRFGNALFEPLWNSAHVDHVQITVAEDVGVGSRTAYYDSTGALRDMLQNHLLQLLCFVAMEPPSSMHADAVRDEKVKVLRALKPLAGREALAASVCGQYRAGVSGSQRVSGYAEETGNPGTKTDTFFAMRADVRNWRWAGVPFYLRTGKRLAQRVSEIVVGFRPVAHSIFDSGSGTLSANRLVIRLQPDEGMRLWLMVKKPGPGGIRLRSTSLDMTFAEAFGGRHPEAYERLLMDVVRGDPTLFMRRDEVETAWSWVDPIHAAWVEAGEAPRPYPAGSWGPSAAFALIERDGRTWHDDPELA